MTTPHRFGPYYLDARIAVGGTAEVYLARPCSPTPNVPDRLVVKRLLPHFASDPEGRTMFDREARLHAAVTHENVVTVYHSGKDDRGEPYLAMEYIDGVDGYRLLRRLRQESEHLPVGVAVYVAREVLRALESVHAAIDPTSGGSLGIVHRDVSPSNIYLSKDGTVKLGDFGIARATARPTLRSDQGHVLKGKFAYLAPEQVAGENADHRADLFSLATVLAEMLLNRPLFPGGGQLAILLAIRDCRIDALEEIKARLPPGLFEVLQKALSRRPEHRFASAADLANALSPFEADARLAVREIAARVRWVQAASSSADKLGAVSRSSADKLGAVRPSTNKLAAARTDPQAAVAAAAAAKARELQPTASEVERAGEAELELALSALDESPLAAPVRPGLRVPREPEPMSDDPPLSGEGADGEAKTSEYQALPSRVLKVDGTELGPWTFARLMEALATGQLQRGDRVDFVGRGFLPVEEIDEFQRFFPSGAGTTGKLAGPGSPDFHDEIGPETMFRTLMMVLLQSETGVLFAETSEGDGSLASRGGKKELYFVQGKLHHVASNNAHELLGEYLVRRNKLAREELDLALAVLPRYSGRMGDTLISLGLVSAVDIFRAIREQGRDRVADLFLWRGGHVTFYRGHTAPHVEFPLDLDLPALMLAGLETAKPGDGILDDYRASLGKTLALAGARDDLFSFDGMSWPKSVLAVLELVKKPITLRDMLTNSVRSGGVLSTGDVLRATQLLLGAGLIVWTA